MRYKDITGKRFWRWTVLRYDHGDDGAIWLCRCDCGTEKTVSAHTLKNGQSKSCGCFKADRAHEFHTRHGESASNRTPEYTSWSDMRNRCNWSGCKQFKDYGGRGIKVCERWSSYQNFLVDMGRKPPKTTLERIDNDGNYEPGNCRWATRKEQSANRRTDARTRIIKWNGESKSLRGWMIATGLTRKSILKLLERGIAVHYRFGAS
jgi:hypothetical protein